MTTTKYIETITFDEIINQALEQKEVIARNFLDRFKEYGSEYSYYTLLASLDQNTKYGYYISFVVDSEIENSYFSEFNMKLLTLGKDEYTKEELTSDLIVSLLEDKLDELRQMTTQKQ